MDNYFKMLGQEHVKCLSIEVIFVINLLYLPPINTVVTK